MLASFEGTGALRALAAPNIDYPQHIIRTRLGIRLPGAGNRIDWIEDRPGWQHAQSYEGASGIVRTESLHVTTRTQVIQRSQASGPLLEIEVSTQAVMTAVIWEVHFQVGGGATDNAIRFEPKAGVLVAYHREHAVAITASPLPARFAGGSQRPGDRSTHWSQGPAFAYVGRVWGRLHIKPILGRPVRILLAYGRPDEATNLLIQFKNRRTSSLASQNGSVATGDEFHDLYERSLVVIDQLRDRSGALIAAPPIDPDNRSSGGYAFCWPRDGAYIAHALDTAGQHAAAGDFFNWALRVQRPHGIWAQRYYADGTAAPAWSEHQLDETGTILWALDRHLRVRPNELLESRGLTAAVDAFQTIRRSAVTGWPPSTQNLWEDHLGQHAYTLASLLAAATAWEKRAMESSEHEAAALLGDAALQLGNSLDRWPTNDEGVMARSMVRGRRTSTADFTADISLLGLSVPFKTLRPTDERLRATVANLSKRLSTGNGRLLRYAGDRYRGGNPWPLATLWMAWHQIRAGLPMDAAQGLKEVLRDRTPAGLLAEQVDARTGAARWVVPLSWAHAWYIVVRHGLLQNGNAER